MSDGACSDLDSAGRITDADLVVRFQKGNREAFSELAERYLSPMTRFVLRMVRDEDIAKDIVQTVFLKAYEGLSSFQGTSSFKTWLYRIAVNTTTDHFRKCREHADEDVSQLPAPPMDCPSVQLDRAQSIARLRKAVTELPEKQGLTLQLRVYGEMSYSEIAEILGGTEGGARANFFQAVRTLRAGTEDRE